MRAVVVGSQGQLGTALQLTHSDRFEVKWVSHSDLDVTNAEAVATHPALSKADVVINATAFTDVDRAESEPEAAFAVNAKGVQNLALRCADENARLIHVSTDYVFGGSPIAPAELKRRAPWRVDSEKQPTTVYGKSKLAGEEAIRQLEVRHAIVRTAWVYSGNCLPHKDFVSTMLQLKEDRETISVVNDQWGNPTFVFDLAEGIWQVVEKEVEGTLHAVGGGEAVTWFDLAQEIMRCAGENPNRILPVFTSEFPRPAPRPQWSALDSSSWSAANLDPLPEWRSGVRRAVAGTLLQL